MYRLVIGNKNYSSWSLRAWLVLEHFGIPFETQRVSLYTETSRAELATVSPSLQVPVLYVGNQPVWDSLAIVEELATRHPELPIWPAEPALRGLARSAAAEMHAGFHALRTELPMNCRARAREVALTERVRHEIARLVELWRYSREQAAKSALATSASPFLFGEFCAADAFFAPVAIRFRGYGVAVDEQAEAYVESLIAHSAVVSWCERGAREVEVIELAEVGHYRNGSD